MGFVSAFIAAHAAALIAGAVGTTIAQTASAAKDAGKSRRSAGVQAREEQARQETAASKLEQDSKDKARESVVSRSKTLLRSKTTRTSATGAKLGLGDVSRKELLGS